MFMTPTESAKFFKQINDAFDELQKRVTSLEARLEEMKETTNKARSGNNTKTKEKA